MLNNLTLLASLSFKGDGELFLKGRSPFNLPLINGGSYVG